MKQIIVIQLAILLNASVIVAEKVEPNTICFPRNSTIKSRCEACNAWYSWFTHSKEDLEKNRRACKYINQILESNYEVLSHYITYGDHWGRLIEPVKEQIFSILQDEEKSREEAIEILEKARRLFILKRECYAECERFKFMAHRSGISQEEHDFQMDQYKKCLEKNREEIMSVVNS